MWPDRGAAVTRTEQAEAAISDLYAEALRRWAPAVRAAVLPALTAAALPPDPESITGTQATWQQHADEIVLAGIGVVWAAAAYEAATEMGAAPVEAVTPELSTVVLGIVAAALVLPRDEVVAAVGYVDASPALAAGRDEFLATKRPEVAAAPVVVQQKVAAALAEPRLTVTVTPEDRPEVLRARAAEVLDPSSPEMRDVARHEGYQAASVLNNAVVAAAAQSEDADELEKTWIATLDGKTRPTHWAADGQRVPLAGTFTIGGEQMRFPGDPAASPAERMNCRCRVGVLARGEELPDEVDRHTERLNGRDSVAINREGRTQAEEIERRRRAGNVRARDDEDGIGRVASGGWSPGGWIDPSEQEQHMARETRVERQERVALEMAAEDGVEGAAEALEELAAERGGEPSVIDEPEPDFASAITAMVAAAATAEPRLRTYDPRLFEDPKLTRPTAPTMNNETGRIYGHLAEWGHVIRGGRDVTPRNRNGYRNFHTSQVPLDNGKQLSVGRLTVQGGHAPTDRGVTAAAARAHYDDVTKAFGLVRVGEDQFGIWFSGVPAPGVDPEVFQQGMTAQLSGDWRDCEGALLDMIAAHAVNSPGFPIYSALTGPDGRDMALVASLGPVRRSTVAAVPALTTDDVKAAVSEALAEDRRAADLVARRDAALTAARAAVGDPPAPLTPAERVEELLSVHSLTAAVSTMPAQFKKYWLSPESGVGWGTAGDFDRCVKLLNAKVVENGNKPLSDREVRGACANLHREATGQYPGKNKGH